MLSRKIIDALLPSGSLWNIKPGSDLDKLFDGIGENYDPVISGMDFLSLLRDPFLTEYLSDLELEYGVKTNELLSEDIRRQQLAALKYGSKSNGSVDVLQKALNDAGFDVQVHENSPAIDPNLLLNSIPFMVAGGDNAYAGFFPVNPGEYTSIAGKTGGGLLVNGRYYERTPEYIASAGYSTAVAGNSSAVAGAYNAQSVEEILYNIPVDSDAWPFFFFVGGDATRNTKELVSYSDDEIVSFSDDEEAEYSASNEILSIEAVDIPIERKEVFERIILKYKPIHSWAGLIINYV